MDNSLLRQIKIFLTRHFDLRQEKEDEQETIESLKKGVEFRGTNLWVLIFAIFLASLGLNTNSTAVIIGAMLISPLMGPIMGFGLGLGITDFELVKRSLRNYLTATGKATSSREWPSPPPSCRPSAPPASAWPRAI